MTLQRIFKNEYGEERWETLTPRLKKLLLKIDSHNEGRKPVTPAQLEKALG